MALTVLAEKMGTLTLEGGVVVKIVKVDGGGVRLFFDRPLEYCGDALVFVGDEEEKNEQDATAPVNRSFWRKKGPPPMVNRAEKSSRRSAIHGITGLFD